MEIKVAFFSGNVEVFTTTMLTHAEDPSGFTIDAVYVDFAHPDTAGIVVDRRFFSEMDADEGWIKSSEVVARPNELENAAAIFLDGSVVMTRRLNEDGSGGEWVNIAALTLRKLMQSVTDVPLDGDGVPTGDAPEDADDAEDAELTDEMFD